MIYLVYCSSGNTVGLEEYISYSEIDTNGYWSRYLEIGIYGTAIRYSRKHDSDIYGALPEGRWDEHEASLAKYGNTKIISSELFESIWAVTYCLNQV